MATASDTSTSSGRLIGAGRQGARSFSRGQPDDRERGDGIDSAQLNQMLGLFSIGLGMAELLAPRAVGRFVGVGERTALIRLCGLREVATGVGLLAGRAPLASAAARVAGDAMDLSLLGAALRSPDAQPTRIAATATAVLGVAALDVYATDRQRRSVGYGAATDEIVRVQVSLAINCSPQKLYQFWRDLENLPRFMDSLEAVTATGERTSHWVAKAGAGAKVEWDSELVEDQPDALLAWRTLPGSRLTHWGVVRFEPAPAGRGTIVHVDLQYQPPGGKLGAAMANLMGTSPQTRIQRELRTLKQLMETGEVATTRGQPSGARSLIGRTLTRSES